MSLGPGPGGVTSKKNLTTTTLVKAAPGQVFTVSVIVAGSGAGALYDKVNTSGLDATTQIGTIPDTVGTYPFYGWPCANGIVLAPGTGQTLAISYA